MAVLRCFFYILRKAKSFYDGKIFYKFILQQSKISESEKNYLVGSVSAGPLVNLQEKYDLLLFTSSSSSV